MIYTIVPIEHILSKNGFEPENSRQPTQSGLHAKYIGEDVLLSRSENGEYSIERLISTNPASYLKKEFEPGNIAEIGKLELL